MRLWSEEKRTGTIELLFTFPITPMQAIIGKFLAAWAFLVFALALTFPIIFTVNYLGDADTGVIFSAYLGSVMLSGAYLSVGLFTSAITRNQVISLILAVVLGLFLILAGFSPVTNLLSRFLPVSVVDLIASFSFMYHFETMQRGILDIRDFIYFLSVMACMLVATQIMLVTRSGR